MNVINYRRWRVQVKSWRDAFICCLWQASAAYPLSPNSYVFSREFSYLTCFIQRELSIGVSQYERDIWITTITRHISRSTEWNFRPFTLHSSLKDMVFYLAILCIHQQYRFQPRNFFSSVASFKYVNHEKRLIPLHLVEPVDASAFQYYLTPWYNVSIPVLLQFAKSSGPVSSVSTDT